MGLFKSEPSKLRPASTIPIAQIDLSKRYDVYCLVHNEERLYENIRFIGIRTFDPITEFSGYVNAFLEIEAPDGARMLIPHFGIAMICEHGTQPKIEAPTAVGPSIGLNGSSRADHRRKIPGVSPGSGNVTPL